MKTSHTLPPSEDKQRYKRWLTHILPAAIVVLIMWLPFGFALTGVLEEWGIVGLFSRRGLFFISDVTSALPAHALRPLTIFPHAVAYLLDPDNFYYWHVLLIAALIIKGSALSILTTRMTGSIKWGMLASVLVLLYPADTMQLSFRSIHINWALSLVLMGSVIFLRALDQSSKARSLALCVVSSLLLAAACGMYEISLLLVAIPALIIFVQVGFKETLSQIKANFLQYLIWIGGAAIYVGYVIHTAPLVQSYQSNLAGSSALTTLQQTYPKLLSVGLLRSIVGGWADAFRITRAELISYWYLALATLVILTIVFVMSRVSQTSTFPDNKISSTLARVCRLAAIGILLICLGYAPFLLSPPHLAISQRTFLYTAPGATLLFISMLWTANYFSRAATSLLAAAVIFIGLGAQLFQFHHYINISKSQQLVLRDIVQNFDGNLPQSKTLLILDYSNQLNHDWMFLNIDMAPALSYMYSKLIDNIEVCYMPSLEWQQLDSLSRRGNCVEDAEGWTFNYPGSVSGPGIEPTVQQPSKRLSKSDAITVVVGDRSNVAANPELDTHRQELASSDSPLGIRFRGITETKPWFDFFKFRDQLPKEEYRWSFGDWWSLHIPTAGSGWRDSEWEALGYTHHVSSAWKNSARSSLYFDLTPQAAPYVISGYFNIFANEQMRSQMKIRINGTLIPIQWGVDGNFNGVVNPETLKSGRNELEFDSPTDDKYYGLSARLDWVQIVKQTK
ncbi:hypothetical protein [Pseudomonas fluorescens]|uniref:Glycosyltransferase RgtA/B/C/D-like domain-containing protein n=1 Tax=Pseudomonas fluorescens TaxID=294 RepID=A0A5E7LXP7_PSEFL|nr:hypothetical protein [Pseudomonas fluorescens]VVP12724.1 hypothetical protein PS880_03404 [Pseudomonas fluorescens]